MKERHCQDKALESQLFEAEDSFVSRVTVNVEGRWISLFGVIKTPPTLVTLLEIPFSSINSVIPRGMDKTMIRVNNETLRLADLNRQDLLQSLSDKFEGSDMFEITSDNSAITLIESLKTEGEIEGTCPISTASDCSERIMKACTLMHKVEKESNSTVRVSFRNLNLNP